jgi:hypothetical protein
MDRSDLDIPNFTENSYYSNEPLYKNIYEELKKKLIYTRDYLTELNIKITNLSGDFNELFKELLILDVLDPKNENLNEMICEMDLFNNTMIKLIKNMEKEVFSDYITKANNPNKWESSLVPISKPCDCLLNLLAFTFGNNDIWRNKNLIHFK